jgi:hypothetical protein
VYAPQFRLRSFGALDIAARETVLRLLLEALVAENVAFLRAHPDTPRLHESGVHYVEDPPWREEWKDIPETLSRKAGDCKDLVAWRLAELRVSGERGATARVNVYAIGPRVINHITVYRPDVCTEEDPSRELGMP